MVNIIYEDEYLIAVNKPSKMLVISADVKKGKVLTDILNQRLAKNNKQVKAHPCHRIDYETSGVIIYAKGKKAQQAVMDQFHKQKVKKKYIAFVHGILKRKTGELRNIIDGKESVAYYKVKDVKADFSIVEVEPVTGRKNQIRIQFKKIGYPLLKPQEPALI